MGEETQTVHCDTHGPQPQAFVCQHIFVSLDTERAVGFHWPAESDDPFPDAWCNKCEAARVAAGGDWNEELMKMVGIKLICGSCYQVAKDIWLRARSSAARAP
jgi:hypothetical protein